VGQRVSGPALLEVCVDTVAGLAQAIAGGAGRIELCQALDLGGLTPSAGLIAAARAAPVPVRAMIRPRAGDFVFTPAEVDVMRRDIDRVREAGLEGVVIGAQAADGALDAAVLRDLAEHAAGLALTLHRVVDLASDAAPAVALAIELGCRTVLTSGGARRADEGLGRIAAMQRQADGRLEILPGGGVTAANVARIVAATGVRSAHASCRVPAPAPARLVELGFAPPVAGLTDRAAVAALAAALRAAVAA
jgi:copper homeostasis protein